MSEHTYEIITPQWEIITQLFDELERGGISCALPSEIQPESDMAEGMRSQGVDISDEATLYSLIYGMAQLVEILWHQHREGKVPRDELLSAMAAMRGSLAKFYSFLPPEHFARFYRDV